MSNSSLQNMCNTHTGKFFPHECAPIVFFLRGLIAKESLWWVSPKCQCPKGPHHQGKLWSECFPSVDAQRGLVAKRNYEVSVSQVSMLRGGTTRLLSKHKTVLLKHNKAIVETQHRIIETQHKNSNNNNLLLIRHKYLYEYIQMRLTSYIKIVIK